MSRIIQWASRLFHFLFCYTCNYPEPISTHNLQQNYKLFSLIINRFLIWHATCSN